MRWDMILKMAKEEGRKEGFEEAREKHLQFIIMNLEEMQKSVDFIAKIVGKSPQYVEQVIEKKQVMKSINN